ncbi:MAG: Rieske 2Fe-2S domain-containing protein [Alphaproteobacteria bacterium]|nr:Rieske 2Fe-2S domain-containing protein [Alphaproteobacteria bacterium]
MLTKENNDLICRVGAGTPMGTAFRRFWLPALLSSELPAPDCDPRRVQLLGEDFVAFRDSDGEVGLLDEYCCHRSASLALGRVEQGGIRCIYHGWKFAVDGTVLETPNVADPAFKQRFKARAYPVREAGGLVWVYLGPAAQAPPFPRWPFFALSSSHLLPVYAVVNCNYVQVMEGLVDSSHLTVLHTAPLKTTGGSELDFAKKTAHMQFNAAARIEAEETEFGFHYVAMRPISDDPDAGVMARIAACVPPCFILNPNGDLFFALVPVSDTRTLFFHVWWDAEKKIGEEPLRSRQLEFVGLDQAALDAYGLSLATCDAPHAACRANNFLQDRPAQRRGHFTGLPSFTQEDAAVSMSAGPIRDRSKEILSVADVALPRLYRALMTCAKQAAEGRDPLGLHADTTNIVGVSGKLEPGAHWRTLAAQHKVIATAA